MKLTSEQKNTLIGSLLALSATILWAGNFIAAKKLAPTLEGYEMNFWRWTIASVAMLPLSIRHIKKDIPYIKRDAKLIFFYGFIGCFLSNLFFYNAPKTAPAVDMTILMTMSSILTIVFARIIFHAPIHKAWVFGSLVSFFGVIVLVTKGNPQDLFYIKITEGHLWTLGCATAFALYSVCMRLLKKGIHLTVFLQGIFTVGAVFGVLSVLFVNGNLHTNITKECIGPLLYISVLSTILAFLAWNSALARIGAVRSGIIYYLVPVFGSIFAVIFLDESIIESQIIGGCLVLGGILFSTFSQHKKK